MERKEQLKPEMAHNIKPAEERQAMERAVTRCARAWTFPMVICVGRETVCGLIGEE
jgi:hypothetical protein